MAAPLAGTTTPIQWIIQLVSGGALTIPSARLEVELFVRTILTGRQVVSEQAWLDTGAPLSVIPFHVHHGRLDWKPVSGIKLTWAGQACDLGTIDIWLPTEQSPAPRGPFLLRAKFPHSDPPGNPVPILLGLEFLLSQQMKTTTVKTMTVRTAARGVMRNTTKTITMIVHAGAGRRATMMTDSRIAREGAERPATTMETSRSNSLSRHLNRTGLRSGRQS